jgi:hypothetical protein
MWLLLSERIYAALLRLYPSAFRAAYGQQMRLTFRDASRSAYQRSGARGLLRLWPPTLLDLLRTALEERARQGAQMSNARLITLAGPLTIVVGALWVAAALGDLAFQSGLLRDEALLGLVVIPFLLSIAPLLVALIGTRLRFRQAAGALGRLGLTLSVAGCAGAILAVLASALLSGGDPAASPQSFWMGYAALGCVLSIRIGYILFGIDALRYRLLPRANLLPLLTGATVVLSLPLDWFGVPAILPAQWATPTLHFAISGVCWVLLGAALLDQRREPRPAAAA